jgi:hypothetical protein
LYHLIVCNTAHHNVPVRPSNRVLPKFPVERLRRDFLGQRPGFFQDEVRQRERGDGFVAEFAR